MNNKKVNFKSWMLRVKLCLLNMRVFKADNIDKKILPEYWEELYNGECTPMDAVREQGMYVKPSFHPSEEYIKYLNLIKH